MLLAALVIGFQGIAKIGTVIHPPVSEMSGIAKSRVYKDVHWVHNDSGDSARVFAMRSNGTVLLPPSSNYWANTAIPGKQEWPGVRITGASNVDWEDIAYDGSNLFIGDMGNNANARQDLGVYVVPEPNPGATFSIAATKFLPIRYPDQTAFPPSSWEFDCESIFYLRGKLYFVTKHRLGGQLGIPSDSSKLYRLDTMHTDQPNILTKIDQISGLGGWVTAADVSEDGTKLVILCQAVGQSVWVFDATAAGDKFFSGTKRKIPLSGLQQCEGICFEGNDRALFTNEQREIFRLKI